jgi:hypothetical protein
MLRAESAFAGLGLTTQAAAESEATEAMLGNAIAPEPRWDRESLAALLDT